MNRKLYPPNWNAIALAIKTAADWKCQQCERPCRRPEDCSPENLKALCSVCHTRYDLSQMALKAALKKEREGQLRLPL